jgi:hypothetical protein
VRHSNREALQIGHLVELLTPAPWGLVDGRFRRGCAPLLTFHRPVLPHEGARRGRIFPRPEAQILDKTCFLSKAWTIVSSRRVEIKG